MQKNHSFSQSEKPFPSQEPGMQNPVQNKIKL